MSPLGWRGVVELVLTYPTTSVNFHTHLPNTPTACQQTARTFSPSSIYSQAASSNSLNSYHQERTYTLNPKRTSQVLVHARTVLAMSKSIQYDIQLVGSPINAAIGREGCYYARLKCTGPEPGCEPALVSQRETAMH